MRDKVRLMGYPAGCYHPAKAGVTQGRFGHQLGNCVSGNVMMRLWPQILKAGNLLKARADIRDTWAELVAFCEEYSLTVPVRPEPSGGFQTHGEDSRGGQTPGARSRGGQTPGAHNRGGQTPGTAMSSPIAQRQKL